MNWAALAAFGSLFSVVAVVVGGAFVYGKLTQQVVDNRDKTAEHATTLGAHGERITAQEIKVGKIEEWKAGIRIGARLAPEKEVQ